MLPKLDGQLIEQIASELRMGNRPSPKENRELDLVAAIEKPGRLATLGLKVVIADLRLDPDFFQFDDVLIPSRVPFFATLLISEFAIVH